MQPYELIRHAAELIRTQGWACGKDEDLGQIAARDVDGAPLRLLATTTAGDGRTRVNPAAYSFSIYGALVKAQELYAQPTHIGLMWATLMQLAEEAGAPAAGGTNYVHPVIGLNEMDGQTKEGVLAFMEQAAAAIEAKLNPPAESTS